MVPDRERAYVTDIDQAVSRWDLHLAASLAEDYHAEAAGDPVFEFRSAVVLAQTSLLAGRPERACEALRPHLDRAGVPHREQGAQVHLLLAEGLARTGQPAEARRLLSRVPAERLRQDTSQALRALRIRLLLGDDDIDRDIAGVVARLQANMGKEHEALLWCEAGRAHFRAGEMLAAGYSLRRAEELARGRHLHPVRAYVLLQAARLEHLQGQLGRALQHLDRVADIGQPHQRLEAKLLRALVLIDVGERGAATALAAEALAARDVPGELTGLATLVRELLVEQDEAGQGLSVEAQGAAHAARGDLVEARRCYASALQSAAGPARQARVSLALGLLDEGGVGQGWLRQAEWLARQNNLPEVLGRGLVALGRRAAARGEEGEGEARGLFEEAIVISKTQASELPPVLAAAHRHQRRSVLRHLLEAACHRRDAEAVFRYQELERGRLLLEWLSATGSRGAALFSRPDWLGLLSRLADCERRLQTARQHGPAQKEIAALRHEQEALIADRDRLFERHLRERDRPPVGLLPPLPSVSDLAASLPAGTLYVAPVLASGGDVYLLAATRERGAEVLYPTGESVRSFREVAEELQQEITRQLSSYSSGWYQGQHERGQLDRCLEAVGASQLGHGLRQLFLHHSPRRLVWVPDAGLSGLPIHAVRWAGSYLIEHVEVAWAFAGAHLVAQRRRRGRRRGWWRPAVAVHEQPAELPAAQREAEGVVAAFLSGRCLPRAGRAELRQWLGRAGVVHLACHAEFTPDSPLSASLKLPSGERLHALECLDEPVNGLPLVTLSACQSGQVAPLAQTGGEVFGLVTGLLGGGAGSVVAGLWAVADDEAPPFMWSFYRRLMGEPAGAALAGAQREALATSGAGGSALFWAAFTLFGDPDAVRPPRTLPGRWLARWRQRRHAGRYPRIGAVTAQAAAQA
ncbi:MAG: CHAT domain-containing protein [Gemmataceae bacterium]